ncbi:MAG: aminotransferase class I/II-fold pyridoxal phosphate-dependent enzyme [Nitrospirae bacterium]|nr:aminotransferase class I/II-fold pyridoxal phosphate-dependent enzyme [Nitrospirota bacterium]
MVDLAESRKVSFHTPGHKSGKGISTRFRKYVGPKIFTIDLTTLDEVDSLQKPTGVIKEAQELAARAYGADRSFFLVNGTSGGNQAMILAACRPGDEVLVARNAHKSVITGLILCGARPVFFAPAFDEEWKVSLNVTAEKVRAAMAAHPGARTLILTSPNYYGISADLERIIPEAQARGLAVLVDEAHGPHLRFHSSLPLDALEAGADCCVQSTHKIIGGMTQASMLHLKGERVDRERLIRVLKSLQTTSPSYILMASLDLARMQMATEGEKLLTKTMQLAEEARARIAQVQGLDCFGRGAFREREIGDLDVTKLTIGVWRLGLSGYEVSQILNHRFHIQAEMADPFHVLVIVSIGDRKDDLQRLVEALRVIAREQPAGGPSDLARLSFPFLRTETMLTPQEAFFAPAAEVPLARAVGRVSAEIVTVYPPGIPLLIPGEVVSEEILTRLQQVLSLEAMIDGLNEENTHLRVVRESVVGPVRKQTLGEIQK